MPPRTDPLDQIGRYRIVKKLGQGGMGTVYLAEDTEMRRRVAIKVPHFDENDGPQVIERFKREARIAGAISHPNICRVYDIGQHGDLHYMVMEFVAGTPLSRLIQ